METIEILHMKQKLTLCAIAMLSFNQISQANCKFIITNNSNFVIKAEAGFYGGNKQTLTVDNATTKSIMVKSQWACTTTSPAGLGMAYIKLVGGKSAGGWVYSPTSSIFRAMGNYLSSEASLGIAPNGNKLALMHNYKPEAEEFAVSIKQADRNNSSKIGSAN